MLTLPEVPKRIKDIKLVTPDGFKKTEKERYSSGSESPLTLDEIRKIVCIK